MTSMTTASVSRSTPYGLPPALKTAQAAMQLPEVQDMLPSRGDRLAEGVDIARKPCRVRIRYRTDVTSDMRLRIRSEEYRIVSGPVELGLREALEMLAEQVTPEGVRP